jgi:CBS domain containing-hemolysin-like protein
MTLLVLAICLTILLSGLCSILEAMILSTSPADIEGFKQKHPRRGARLEDFREEIEETTSAILSLNTIANTLGATLVGGLAAKIFGPGSLIWFSLGMTVGILIFSEVIPKNAGVLYRQALLPWLVPPLGVIRSTMRPVSFICKGIVRVLLGNPPGMKAPDQEIRLLAEKSAKDGNLSFNESKLIANALTLDDISVSSIMTPRTVVSALEKNLTIDEVFRDFKDIPFARLPVYDDTIDKVVGMVRRRDLLTARAENKNTLTVAELTQDTLFIPDNAVAADALQLFLKNHQQLAIVVDEYGSTAGVITMEDVVEHILGAEIFEPDDVAVDMREYARNMQKAAEKRRQARLQKETN